MKTKTNSFTKVINFCVLALFFISTLIFFTSCDNGNSPNDITNEEQNNTQNTDYCEICDGVQTENCGIKHKCDDENCVEYSDNKIYKDGHTHDYCEEVDCDGKEHKGQDHDDYYSDNDTEDSKDNDNNNDVADDTETESDTEYESWFKLVSIGDSDLYQVYVPEHSFNEHNKLVEGSIDNYLDQYQKYVESLLLNKELTGDVEIDFARIKAMAGTSEQYKLDTLIGTTSNTDPNTIKGINNVCESAIENIMNNIGSGDTVVVDRAYFAIYYKAIANEAYRRGYNGEPTTKNQNGTYDTNTANQMENQYNEEKNKCISLYGGDGNNLPFKNKYLYDESGNLNPELVQQFDEMVVTTANKLGIEPDKARNIMKLSFTASVIEGMHDDLSTNNTIDHTHTDSCYNNEIYEVVIEPIAFPSLTMAQPTKLNKLNFNKDFGRELV